MSDQLSVNSNQYPTGAAGLFASLARQPLDEKPVVAPCTECGSENTVMIDHKHDIYQCSDCGEYTIRATTG